MPAAIPLALAIGDYDHARDPVVEGVDLTVLRLPVEEIFFRFTRYREWEASELSFARYVALRASGDDGLVAIPAFPSRVFRHSAVYVRAGAGIARPADLAGRRVGVPEWAQTATVGVREILAEHYGLDLRAVEWVQAGVNEAGRREGVPLALPERWTAVPTMSSGRRRRCSAWRATMACACSGETVSRGTSVSTEPGMIAFTVTPAGRAPRRARA